jgi:hypothetical protein
MSGIAGVLQRFENALIVTPASPSSTPPSQHIPLPTLALSYP